LTFGRSASATLWTIAHCSAVDPGGDSQRVSQLPCLSLIAPSASTRQGKETQDAKKKIAAAARRAADRAPISTPGTIPSMNDEFSQPKERVAYQKGRRCQALQGCPPAGRSSATPRGALGIATRPRLWFATPENAI
jgi:hypothetical protein